MHCLNACPLFYYDDAWQCKDCMAHCEVCNDAVSCTTCETGFFYHGSACLASCPTEGFYPNTVSRVCEACSDSNCLLCSTVDKDTCTRCDINTRYYLSDSSCLHCPLPDVVTDTDCITCSMTGFYITPEGTCVE